jgi:hypothetical protein
MADDSVTKPKNAASRLTGIVVVRQTVARFLIDYYWLFVFLSFFLFLYQAFYYEKRMPGPVELSFYPLYFLIGGLTKYLLQKKIPGTFARLRDTGSLEEKTMQGLTKGFVRQLNHPLGDAFGIVFGLLILWFYEFGWPALVSMNLGYTLSSVAIITIDVLLAYAVGVAIWKAGVTAWEFRQLGRRGKLKIRPFHPDGCAGLAAIGQLFFSLSFVLIVAGLFLSGWLLYGRWINPSFDHAFGYVAPWFAGSLIVVVAVSIAAFFLPLLAVHRLMKEEAARHETRVLALAGRIADLEESLLSSESWPNHEELDARLAQLESLRSTYLHQRKIPTWPVDFETRGKFLSAQIGLWVGIPTSVLNLWDKVKPLTDHLIHS